MYSVFLSLCQLMLPTWARLTDGQLGLAAFVYQRSILKIIINYFIEMKRVVCTGLGMVSPLGLGTDVCWAALLNSKCGISKVKPEHSFPDTKSEVAAYVPEDQLKDTLAMQKHYYIAKNSKQLSRATCLAMIAAHEALEDAELLDNMGELKKGLRTRTGTAIGQGMVDFQDIYDNGSKVFINKESSETIKLNQKKISPYFMTRALVNMASGNISIRYKSGGPNHCVSTACATGAHSIGDAYNFIKYGKADMMICGGTEAAINSLSLAGFGRLKALSAKYNVSPELSSRPFDENRCGFVIGEGAGVIILESLEHVRARKHGIHKIHAEVLGYGTSSDAYHLTAPSPTGDGAYRCMKEALKDAGLEPSDISLINAHATSTPLGDDIECAAIEELFFPPDADDNNNCENTNTVTVNSCKGSIGHLLGAAGSTESIFGILACKFGKISPNLNLEKALTTPRNKIRLAGISTSNWDAERRILLKNSFGFGGTNASIVFSQFIE